MTTLNPHVKMISPEEAEGQLQQIYQQFEQKDQPVPKWVQVMANNPQVLAGFMQVFQATMDESPLPRILKWKVAQAVSDLNQCEYCVDVTHSQLKQFGLSDEEVESLEQTLNEKEKVAIDYAQVVTEEAYKIEPKMMKKVKQHFNDAELVELTAVIGLFNFINRFNVALNILPE